MSFAWLSWHGCWACPAAAFTNGAGEGPIRPQGRPDGSYWMPVLRPPSGPANSAMAHHAWWMIYVMSAPRPIARPLRRASGGKACGQEWHASSRHRQARIPRYPIAETAVAGLYGDCPEPAVGWVTLPERIASFIH